MDIDRIKRIAEKASQEIETIQKMNIKGRKNSKINLWRMLLTELKKNIKLSKLSAYEVYKILEKYVVEEYGSDKVISASSFYRIWREQKPRKRKKNKEHKGHKEHKDRKEKSATEAIYEMIEHLKQERKTHEDFDL